MANLMDYLDWRGDLTLEISPFNEVDALILAELAAQDEHVEAYLLSRNYGHQMALTCGLDHADGDAVITMDGDLQHPPELIPELLRLWEAGNEIVQTKRMATEDAGFFKNLTSAAYYKLINT